MNVNGQFTNEKPPVYNQLVNCFFCGAINAQNEICRAIMNAKTTQALQGWSCWVNSLQSLLTITTHLIPESDAP